MTFFQYPLDMRFKLVALSPQIIASDATGSEVMYIHQKVFNIREDVRIYSDQSRAEEVFRMNAEKIMDFNTRYNFYLSNNDQHLGSCKAQGWRSIWRTTYLLDDSTGQQTHYIKEDNPWVKMIDAAFSAIPYAEWFSGFVFHPAYTCYRGTDREDESHPVMHLQKEAGFFEGRYTIELMDESISKTDEIRALLSFLILVQFMRRRG